ncbi:hypothetical protein BB560_005735 [Smittium megazygosporum]|uniref:SRP19 protein n=2 Tax=Smittium megazygosporum TaxID=133381 RepID=A0A2T9YYZ2_9FUNG|nr:hypothetical protein BB560_005735 [Smittium megazygosporum]
MASRIDDVDDMDFPLPGGNSGSSSSSMVLGGNSKMSGLQNRFESMTLDPTGGKSKSWVCLYPLYFDYEVPRDKGRKVPKDYAVKEPHARQLAEAVRQLGLTYLYEPTKTHPRTMFNKGRVRVQLKEENLVVNHNVPNRKILMKKVGELMPKINIEREPELTPEDIIEPDMGLPGMPPMGNLALPGAAGSSSKKSTQKKSKPQKQKKGKGSKNLV